MHTELGRSQGEVQRCTLSWEVGKELGEEGWQRAWPRIGKAEVQVEVDADMVKRNWRRRTRRRTTLIKSNNPHLAGGELAGLLGIMITHRNGKPFQPTLVFHEVAKRGIFNGSIHFIINVPFGIWTKALSHDQVSQEMGLP